MDDENQIVNAPIVHTIANFPIFFTGGTFGGNGYSQLIGGYYRPLPTIVISILYMLFGPNPFFFHLTQVMLHICNSVFVFLFFQQLLRKLKISFILALIFLIHPINSETVNYISAIQTTLCFFFGFLALLFVLRKQTKVTFIITCTLLFLSLLSKEDGIVFLLLLIPLQWFLKKIKNWNLYLYESFILLIYFFLRVVIAHVHIVNTNPFIPLMNAPLSLKLVNVPAIIFYYLHAFIFPKMIAVDQNWVVRTLTWQSFYFPVLICFLIGIAIISISFYFAKKNNQQYRLFLFFAFWFISFMLLTLPLFPLDFTVADRWFYFPIVGLLGMISIVVQSIVVRESILRWTTITVLTLLIGAFTLRTIVRNNNWHDGLTLYTHDIRISQNSFDLESNLGVALLRAGDLQGAEIHMKKSLTLAPDLPEPLLNLGIVYEKQHDIPNAKKYYLLAAQHNVSTGLANYAGLLLFYENDASDSAKILADNIDKYPIDQYLWLLLATAYQREGNQQLALKAAEYAYRLGNNQQSAYVYNQILNNEQVDLK